MKRFFQSVTIISVFLTAGFSYAALSGSDTFDFFDSSKWGLIGDSNDIQVANGRVELAVGDDDSAGYAWILNSANYNDTWTASIDVFLPATGLNLDEMAGIGLYAVWPTPDPLDSEPLNYVGIEVEREGFGNGVLGGEYIGYKKTGSTIVELDDTATSSYMVSLKLLWDAQAQLFSLFYDDNGGQDSWTLFTTTGISDWGMTGDDDFAIGITGWASDTSLEFSDGLAFDNFNAATVPEPGVMMLFAVLGFPYLLLKKNRR